jgi:hypothetical protein
MDKERVIFTVADDPESRLVFDAPKLKAQTTIGDYPVELSRDMSDKKTGAKISRDFGPFELTGSVSRQNKENTALLRAASDRAFIEASRDPYNRALSAGYSDGNFNANFQRSLPNDGGRPSNSLNLGYKTTFAEGGPAQQVTQFRPTFSPAQQGLGSIQPYQAPDTPAMEMSPQDYNQSPQYAPTQQYSAPAASPMTAGLGSYMEGLKYKAPPPPAPPPPTAPAARNYSWNGGKYADEAALRGALGTYATQNNYTPASVDTWMGDQAKYGISSAPVARSAPATALTAAAPSVNYGDLEGLTASPAPPPPTASAAPTPPPASDNYAYNPQTQQYMAPAAPVEPVAATPAVNYGSTGLPTEDNTNYNVATGGRIHAYAQGGSTPQGIASLGRGQDSMLVHMTPGEVQGLQRLAMAHGGSLTINPQTGLPEAGFLSSLLPMIGAGIGIAMAPATGGASLYALGGGALGGMLGSSMEGKSPLMGAIMGGISGYGMGGLGESLSSMGVEQANKLASQELAETNASANLAGDQAYKNALREETARQAAATANAATPPAIPTANNLMESGLPEFASSIPTATPPTFGQTPEQYAAAARDYASNAAPNTAYSKATQEALARGPAGNMVAGVQQLGTTEGLKTLGGKLGYAGMAGLAAPLISSAMQPAKFNPPAKTPTQYSRYGDSTTPGYTPPRYNPLTGNYDPASYGPGSYYTNPTQYAAEGGAVGYKQGGIADFYPLTGDRPNTGGLGGAAEKPRNSRKINDPDSGAGIYDDKADEGPYSDLGGIYENTPSDVENLFDKASAATLDRYIANGRSAPIIAAAKKRSNQLANAYNKNYGDTTSAAQGGLMGLNTYAAGGKLLRGPGDGMSDSIPAVIQGAKPQRAALADGEFVIPADVVSHLGNGSTEAGSRQLYAMMDKIRKARTGNPKQGKQINPERFIPA